MFASGNPENVDEEIRFDHERAFVDMLQRLEASWTFFVFFLSLIFILFPKIYPWRGFLQIVCIWITFHIRTNQAERMLWEFGGKRGRQAKVEPERETSPKCCWIDRILITSQFQYASDVF